MLTRRTAIAAIYGAAGVSCLAEGNVGTIALPARIGRNRQILIPVKINGSAEIWCLLDTGGANLVYLRAAKAAALGIEPTSTAHSSGALDTEFRAGGRAKVTLDAGAIHRTNQELYLKEFNTSDEGVVGAAVFADFIVELDFLRPAVRLHPPASFRYEEHGAVFAIDLWSHNPHVQVLLSIDDHDPVKARMTVDSGAGGIADAFLTPRFSDDLRRVGRSISWAPDKQGFSTCRIRRVAVGPFGMENPLLVLPPVQGFGGDANAPDGMLAINFLRRYRIYIDYATKQMILEPNSPGAQGGAA
jgi:hypothetical protein